MLTTRNQLKLAIGLIIFSLILSFGYGLYTFYLSAAELQSSGITQEALRRIQGLTIDPNAFAASLVIFIPIPFLLGFEAASKKQRCLYWILFALMALAVIATFSRGGLISFGFVMLWLAIKMRHNRTVLWSTLAVVAVILILIPGDLWERFNVISSLRGEASARWRFKLLIGAWELFMQSPFLGIGLGGFIEESIRFIPRHQVAHNMYLEVAAETGVLGLVALLGLIWVTIGYFKEGGQLFDNSGEAQLAVVSDALKIGFCGFLIASLFLSMQYDVLFWGQLGLAGATRSIAERIQ